MPFRPPYFRCDSGGGSHFPKVLCSLHDSAESFFCRLQSLVAEVKSAPVMSLEDEEPDGHGRVSLLQQLVRPGEQFLQGDEIPEGLAHLLAVDGDHVVVHPVTYAAFAP